LGKDALAALKPELRILWQTLVTWLTLAWHWVWNKLLRRGTAS
jgi:hypothetical protein